MVNRLFSDEIVPLLAAFDPVAFTSNGTWVVPYGIRNVRVDCVAAQGQNGNGGYGGRVQCLLAVVPNSTLYIVVGKMEDEYNASDIRTVFDDNVTDAESLSARIVVAGAGGAGTGGYGGGAGGGLEGAIGGYGYSWGGWGGTQTSGGAGGCYRAGTSLGTIGGSPGTFGLGGRWYGGYPAGRGGAGWYGGGGGSSQDTKKVGVTYGGGGGGSSYTHPTLCSNVVHTQGFRAGNGYVTISMV